MFRHLKYDDARAIDLLLNTSQGNHDGYAWGHIENHMNSNASDEARLKGAQRVLQLLGTLPAGEPPTDLVARTLARIDESGASMHFFPSETDRPMPELGAGSMRAHA